MADIHLYPTDFGGWRINNTPFVLMRTQSKNDPWKIASSGVTEVARWIERVGLQGKRFSTRKAAAKVVLACLECQPMDDLKLRQLNKLPNGDYQVDGAPIILIRNKTETGWLMTKQGAQVGYAKTLRQAQITLGMTLR